MKKASMIFQKIITSRSRWIPNNRKHKWKKWLFYKVTLTYKLKKLSKMLNNHYEWNHIYLIWHLLYMIVITLKPPKNIIHEKFCFISQCISLRQHKPHLWMTQLISVLLVPCHKCHSHAIHYRFKYIYTKLNIQNSEGKKYSMQAPCGVGKRQPIC